MKTDEEMIAELTEPDAVRPVRIRAGESLLVRLLVLLSVPVWGAVFGIAVLLRLGRGKRPVLVFHERVGHGRKRLWVPKIATSAVATNERRFAGLIEVATGGPVQLDVPDGFEQWLRHCGFDELPQLSLIVRGEMRLVGPRPVTPTELAEMAATGNEVGVDTLQPGLVGLWQVLDRHRYELDERRALDALMIDNWSRRLQLRIVALAWRQALSRLASR